MFSPARKSIRERLGPVGGGGGSPGQREPLKDRLGKKVKLRSRRAAGAQCCIPGLGQEIQREGVNQRREYWIPSSRLEGLGSSQGLQSVAWQAEGKEEQVQR